MHGQDEIERLSHSAPIVIFHSALTDLGGLDHWLDRRGKRWHSVELAMDDPENRARFAALKHFSGHATLPQVFMDGRFVGGIRAAREALDERREFDGPSPTLSLAAMLTVYASLLPFIGLAAWLWLHPVTGAAARVLAIYAGVVLATIGAVHFGWALGEHADHRRYGWSIAPAIVGWILASLPPGIGLPLLAVALLGTWHAEQRWFADSFPRWYRLLRTQLSWLAAVCLVAAWIAVLVH
ncbi:MAG: DUF3429 family protein [Gammaproteobacteria bacterium]